MNATNQDGLPGVYGYLFIDTREAITTLAEVPGLTLGGDFITPVDYPIQVDPRYTDSVTATLRAMRIAFSLFPAPAITESIPYKDMSYSALQAEMACLHYRLSTSRPYSPNTNVREGWYSAHPEHYPQPRSSTRSITAMDWNGFLPPTILTDCMDSVKSILDSRERLARLYATWDSFDVPTLETRSGQYLIDEPFLHFPRKTPVDDVYRWFESQHPEFSVGEIMSGVRRWSDTPPPSKAPDMAETILPSPPFPG